MMIVIAVIEIAQGNKTQPKSFDFKQLPDLFGVCIYSFMCQHSLPGMITPMKSKKYVFPMLAADYGLIFIFYSVMCYTAVYQFGGELQDIYTYFKLFGQFSCVETISLLSGIVPSIHPEY